MVGKSVEGVVAKSELAFGDFIFTSYDRDFDVIKSKFPKLDGAFKDGFVADIPVEDDLLSPLPLGDKKEILLKTRC
jgi:hypothetical protein